MNLHCWSVTPWHKGQSSSIPLINIGPASLSRIWGEGNKWIWLMREAGKMTPFRERDHFISSILMFPDYLSRSDRMEKENAGWRQGDWFPVPGRRTRWQSREFFLSFLYITYVLFLLYPFFLNYQSSHRNLFVSLVCVVDTQVAQVFLARDFPRKGNLPLSSSSHIRFQSRVSNVFSLLPLDHIDGILFLVFDVDFVLTDFPLSRSYECRYEGLWLFGHKNKQT